MTDAILLKPMSEEKVTNTDCLRVYWEQGLAPVKSYHLADPQSTGGRENLELSVAITLFEEPLDLHTNKNSEQFLTSRLNAHAPRANLSEPSSPSPRRSGNTSVVLPRNGSERQRALRA